MESSDLDAIRKEKNRQSSQKNRDKIKMAKRAREIVTDELYNLKPKKTNFLQSAMDSFAGE